MLQFSIGIFAMGFALFMLYSIYCLVACVCKTKIGSQYVERFIDFCLGIDKTPPTQDTRNRPPNTRRNWRHSDEEDSWWTRW